MLSKRFSNTIRCNASTYWNYSLTENYNRQLYVEVLKYREYRLLHEEDTGDRVCRRIQYAPPPPPGPLRTLAGRFRASLLTEELVFDRSTGSASIAYIPDAHAARTALRADISCTPVDDNSIERVADCRLSFDLPLIGGLAERTVASFLEQQAAMHARFAEEYIAGLTTPP
jgi:hypothetical protein